MKKRSDKFKTKLIKEKKSNENMTKPQIVPDVSIKGFPSPFDKTLQFLMRKMQ